MLGEALALLAAVVWAFSSLLYKIGLKNANPLVANTYRLLISTLIMLPLMFKIDIKFDDAFFYLQISAVFGIAVADYFFLRSLKYINVSRSVPISSSYPFFAMFFSIFIVKEPVEIVLLLSAFLIVFGIYLLSEEENTKEENIKLGIIFALLTAFLWGFSITFAKLGLKSYSYIEATAIRLPTATVVSFILLYIFHGNIAQLFKMDYKFYYIMGIAGILGIIVGGLLFMASLSLTTTSVASILSSTTPFFTALISNVYLHEKITKRKVFGMISIVVGIYLIYI